MTQEQQNKSLFLFVVSYIFTFTVAANGGTRYSITQLLMGIIFGVVYLIPGFFEREVLQRFSANTRNAIFFPIQVAMAFGIGWTFGSGGNWLIGLPLAGIAVERLSTRSRWLMYAGLRAAIVLPILRFSTGDVALMNAFIISAATGL